MHIPAEDQGRYEKIDNQYEDYLRKNPSLPERWLLEQTILTGPSRRGILKLLPLFAGAHVLDIGTGFGALAFDVAATMPVSIAAVDADLEVLNSAEELYYQMMDGKCFLESSKITFIHGSVYELPFPDAAFDIVLVRFVYQHLQDPRRATHEIARVLKANGHVCLMDVDDQLLITYPEQSGAFAKLQDAVHRLQHLYDGDRWVGRKLAGYIHEAGITVIGTAIYPDAQFTSQGLENSGLELTVRRFEDLRGGILEHGIMTASEFDGCLEDVQTDFNTPLFHANGLMIALGRKPGLDLETSSLG